MEVITSKQMVDSLHKVFMVQKKQNCKNKFGKNIDSVEIPFLDSRSRERNIQERLIKENRNYIANVHHGDGEHEWCYQITIVFGFPLAVF